MSYCKTCKAEIKWIETPDGKRHPLDSKPIKAWQQVGRDWALVNVYISHFATCPDADSHRKPREREKT